ncbi:tol-pal system protein YbgF [Stutzerimonas nosocomialis]|uniref:Cell division coordinator CpoB n=1 Tax=Stutzerimonas nosocomialis TaxID=1056496 RepID=A0A5R9QFE5_9GAMM|nr:tol-pal system protein YbgF [Stutzerimonas nosocomialis]TLX55836.1 tol-pal system protein YbgF [Stutzerimonas nosocomialis]TLX59891.1 tol-pal system protein YbgF [Stutzerimonas nosocomialis]TLX63866.1 tol-pal system protein YbgF [Stutzerimonas nosocomialis]
MRKYCRALTVLSLSLPLHAMAQVPVVEYDSQSAGSGGSGYPAARQDTGGAYAEGGVNTPSSAQGMLFIQLQQMQEEIAQLRGMVEQQQNQIQQLQREGLERYQELDRRLSSGASAGAVGAQNSSTAGAIDASETPREPAQQAQAGNQSADPANEKLYYDAAFDLIKAKDFDKASQAFAAFLRRYPQSQYAGNAQYWLGEVNLAKGDLQAAGQAFAKVSQTYPNHAKVPDSLYKLADVELRLGNRDRAQGILREVISQYPNSSAAQLAQRQLSR